MSRDQAGVVSSRSRAWRRISPQPESSGPLTAPRRGWRRWAALAALVSAVVLALPTAAFAASGAPLLSGSVSNNADLAGTLAVAVSGSHAYSAAYAAGRLTVVDISNPAAPVVAGASASANSLLNATNVAISGGYAYVVSKNRNGAQGSGSNDDGSGNSLTILDIHTNPAVPAIVGTLHDPLHLFGAYGIEVSGGDAFIAAQGCLAGQPCPLTTVGNSFAVVDVSNPASPKLVATLQNSSLPAPWTGSNALAHPTSVAISGSDAYVTSSYSNALTAIDISNPSAPKIVAVLRDNTNLNFDVDVAVAGNYAYVADQGANSATAIGLAVVDISTPSNPKVVAGVSSPSQSLNGAYRVRARGDFAYVSASGANAVAGVDVSDPANPRLVFALADLAHLHKTTGLDVDPSGQLIASSPELSIENFPIYPPFTTPTGTISVFTLDPAPIAVTIAPSSEPPPATMQTAASFAFSTNDAVASVRCQLDGAPLGPCMTPTSQQYGGLGPGSHTFTVKATDAAANTATTNYTWVIGVVNLSPPTVSGPLVENQTLTAAAGNWSGSPAPILAYQWRRCDGGGANCVAIAGANASTYTLTVADVGSTIDVLVTATSGLASASATSSATAAIAAAPAARTPTTVTLTAPAPGATGATGRPVKIERVAVVKIHGRWVLEVRLSRAARLVVSVKRLHPGRPVALTHIGRSLKAGSSTLTLSWHAHHGATYAVIVTVQNGARRVTASSKPFTVR